MDKANLVEDHMKLAHYVARKYMNSMAVEYEDLFQQCCIGLVRAAKSYKEDSETKFSTYAVSCMENEMRMVYRKKFREYGKIACSLESEVKLPSGRVVELSELLIDEKANFEESLINNDTLERLMNVLSSREKEIVIQNYILDYDQMKISRLMGCTSANVSRILKNALSKMKKASERSCYQ